MSGVGGDDRRPVRRSPDYFPSKSHGGDGDDCGGCTRWTLGSLTGKAG